MGENVTRITLTVDRSKLFDAIAEVGDGGKSVGERLAGVLLSGSASFSEAVGLAFYGIEVDPDA